MAIQKGTILMQLTTSPPDRTTASPHTGGWSESFWAGAVYPATDQFWLELIRTRQNLLPTQASIVGYRFGVYTIVGNRLSPGGSSTGRLQKPGQASLETDMPNVALMMAGTTAGAPNSSRFTVKCIPDDMVKFGEYQPNSSFKRSVTAFQTALINGGFGFLGRDLTLPVQRVLSIANNVITLTGVVGAVIGTDSIRLLNVKDVNGKPVQGAFRTTAINGFAYTVIGLTGVTAGESGSARVERPKVFLFNGLAANRAVVRKIGRPFEGYRGKASKRPA